MRIGFTSFVTGLALMAGFVCGCSKSQKPEAPPSAASVDDPAAISQIHWVGKKAIAQDPLGTNFFAIWSMPESYRVETQTVDRLASAPWRLGLGQSNEVIPDAALLRPLVENIVEEESWTVYRRKTNEFGELAFAIRLDEGQAALWETNLAAVLKSLTGIEPSPVTDKHGWLLQKHQVPDVIELARVGQWTVVGVAQTTNALLSEVLSRLANQEAPVSGMTTRGWLNANVDLAFVLGKLCPDWRSFENMPRLELTAFGQGLNIHTDARLSFPNPLSADIEPWVIPTNLVNEPITGFAAARGIKPLLKSFHIWDETKFGPAPDQFCAWSWPGIPGGLFITASLGDATNQVHRLAESIVGAANPALASIDMGHIDWDGGITGAVWQEMPFGHYFIRAATVDEHQLAYAGSYSESPENSGMPPILLQSIMEPANLLYREWELTGPRMETFLYMTQLFRMLSERPQLESESASVSWLVTASDRLGNCTTEVYKNDQKTLGISRVSETGFTAIELLIIGDWLESPEFPRGFYTLLAPKPAERTIPRPN